MFARNCLLASEALARNGGRDWRFLGRARDGSRSGEGTGSYMRVIDRMRQPSGKRESVRNHDVATRPARQSFMEFQLVAVSAGLHLSCPVPDAEPKLLSRAEISSARDSTGSAWPTVDARPRITSESLPTRNSSRARQPSAVRVQCQQSIRSPANGRPVLAGMNNAVFRAFSCCLGPDSLAVFRVFCASLLGLVLLGCRPPATPPEAPGEQRPFDGQQASLFVPAGSGCTELWDPALREWSVQTGGQVSLQEYSPDDANSFWSSLDQSSQPAVCVIPYAWLADGLTSRDFERIPEAALSVESGVSWDDLLRELRERIGGPRRKPQFLPLQAPVLVCYYRKDLLDRAGLKAPVTWEDYSRLVERSQVWGAGLPVVEPWAESFRVTWFLSRAIAAARHPDNFSVFVDLETLQPMIDNPAFVGTLERARADLAHLPTEVWQLSPLECRQRVLEGRACLAIGIEPAGGTNSNSGTPPFPRGEGVFLGVCPLPASTVVYNPSTRILEEGTSRGGIRLYRSNLTGWQGMVACVFQRKVAGSSLPAWNALAQVAGPDFLNRLPPGLAGLTRESQLGDASLIIGPELTGTESAEFLAVTADVLRDGGLVLELPFPRRTEFANLLKAQLTAALRGETPAEEALRRVARDWSSLIDEIGHEPFRRSYRQILGLTPKPFSTAPTSASPTLVPRER